jgi:chromosome segregation ATPase
MKKYFVIAATLLASVYGCKNNEKEIADMQHKQDSLISVINEKNTSVDEFLKEYSEIETNLDQVARKGNMISENIKDRELKGTQKERINESIQAINQLMDQNREKLAALNRKLKSSNNKNSQLEKMIEQLNQDMVTKDAELVALNEQLAGLNTKVDQLTVSLDTMRTINTAQSQTISDQTTAMHTAYYIEGKSSELKDLNVINKEGGVLGVGKTMKMNSNVDNSKFTKIDYTQVSTISVNSKDAKIITTHPMDSYTWEKEQNKVVSLKISDPNKFWSQSKYLVIVKD